MVRTSTFLSLLFCIVSNVQAQEKEYLTYLPKEAVGSIIYIEKYEPLGLSEQSVLLAQETSRYGKGNTLKEIKMFNAGEARRHNFFLEGIMSESNDTMFAVAYHRDLEENINGEYRFVLRWDFPFNGSNPRENYTHGYYIHDLQTGENYERILHLETFMTATKKTRILVGNRDLKQEEVDEYFESTMPKQKQHRSVPSAVKWTLGILGYGLFVVGINILINL